MSQIRLKRRRTGGFQQAIVPRAKRPINKQLVFVDRNAGSTQLTTTLITATFPCTIVGLRWSIAIDQSAGTGTAKGAWLIARVKESTTVSTMSFSNGASFYEPEEEVMAFERWSIDNNTETKMFNGDTKTMRKLQSGDQILFLALGVATDTSNIEGIVQFFCKT